MRKLTKSTIVAGAALAAAIGFSTSPASAAGTWTVTGGGAFTAIATNPILTDTNTGTQLKCTKSNAGGTAPNGTGLSGTAIASISSVTWTSCSGPAGITFGVTAQGLPWKLNATSYVAATGTTTGTLTGVKAHISGLCNADFNGPTSGSTATLTGTYVNSTHTLTISGGNLKAYNVSGICLGLINNGDSATYSANYVVTPSTLKITSP